jgi:hypothetical protein
MRRGDDMKSLLSISGVVRHGASGSVLCLLIAGVRSPSVLYEYDAEEAVLDGEVACNCAQAQFIVHVFFVLVQ